MCQAYAGGENGAVNRPGIWDTGTYTMRQGNEQRRRQKGSHVG